MTNHHVVEGADEIVVTLDDGSQHQAEVVGIDRKTDLALLTIETEQPLPFVTFGDSDAMRVGDWVIAIGNPFGLGGTATTGIVSARGRDLRNGPFDDFLQIDAPINHGNSGGPLFDTQGRVIGVNTAIFSPNGGNVGIGFAIPVSQVAPVIEQLHRHGAVTRAWLGVEVRVMDQRLADELGFSSDTSDSDDNEVWGALVAGVVDRSPADRAGIMSGDVVVRSRERASRTRSPWSDEWPWRRPTGPSRSTSGGMGVSSSSMSS